MRNIGRRQTGRSARIRARRAPLRGHPRQVASRALVVLGLLATVVTQGLVAAPKPAEAAYNGAFASDDSGAPIDVLRADENLFVTGLSDVQGGRVCVVGPASDATCDNPDWGTSNVVVGIGTTISLIEGAPLRAGTWRIRSESKSGGAWVLNTTSETFQVSPCDNTCDTRIAAAQAAQWKAAAQLQTKGAVETCSGFAAADVTSAAQDLRKGVNRGSVKKTSDALDTYSSSGQGFVGTLVGVGGTLLGFEIPDPFGNHAAAMKLLRDVSCTVSLMYQDIVKDPPDFNYGQVFTPTFATVDTLPDSGDSDLIKILDRQAKYGIAALHGYERYLGAVADGNNAGICRQAQAVAVNSYGQRTAMRDSAAELRRFATKAATDPELQAVVATTARKATLVSVYERVRASGFDAAETANLVALGFSAADIALIRQSFDTDIAQLPADQTMAEILTSWADVLVDQSEPFDDFGREAEAVAQAVCGTDLQPIADPQSVAVSQNAPAAITLTGSDPEGQSITYHVTGGPAHGTLSGTAPNLTYTPAAGYLGNDSFTFTTNDGTSDSSPASVTLVVSVKVNYPPLAFGQVVDVVPGVASTITLTGSDANDDTLTYAVTKYPAHGTLAGTAPNLSYTPSASFTDTDSLTFTVSDGTATSDPATVTFVPSPVAARDDALTVQGAQVLDVTDNDAPAGASVGDVTAPDHGTVSCSPYGICLYVADPGYEGPDSFDYTLMVGVNQSTATVAITVEAPPVVAAGKPSAGDDVLQTSAGAPGTVDVLANDTGEGTLQVIPSDGEHGTVTCTASGRCTYTPAAAFVGFDVFTYTLSNGTDVDTGLVRIRVGDTPTSLAVTGTPLGGGSSLATGGTAEWFTRLTNDGPVETALARSRPVTATPSGAHDLVADSARAADGWSLSVNGGVVTAVPGPDALIGTQATSVLPRPLPPISQGTGGDGHVPILVGTKVFAFFHHQQPTQVTCVDRSTGQLCPGYPKTVPVGTRNNPGPGAVVGTQIWVHLYGNRTSGLFCWDSATDQTCGFATNRPGAESWDGTAPLLIVGELWFATGTGRLQCVDPATSAPCDLPPLDTGISFDFDAGDIVNHGTRVYVSNHTSANCLDVATGARCPGWPAGGRELQGNLVRSHDATSGAVDGVCGVNFIMYCVRDGQPDTVITTDVPWPGTDTTYSSSVEAEAGTRTFWGSLGSAGLGCFDWSTMLVCAGSAFSSDGFSRADIGGGSLPSAYGTVWDGSCAVALGDPGKLFTMDVDGTSPCTSLDSGAAPLQIDLRRQRADQRVGVATWNQVRVFDTDLTAGTNFTSFLITIRDATTGAPLASQEMVGTDGTFDLSEIDADLHPSLTVGATSRAVDGGDAWARGHAPKVQLTWNADAAPLAFRTVARPCPTDPIAAVTSVSGDQTARAELPLQPAAPSCPVTTTTSTTTTQPSGSTSTSLPGATSSAPVGQSAGVADARAQPSSETAASQQGTLARTGTDAGLLALLGGLAVALGAVSVTAARRRRSIG